MNLWKMTPAIETQGFPCLIRGPYFMVRFIWTSGPLAGSSWWNCLARFGIPIGPDCYNSRFNVAKEDGHDRRSSDVWGMPECMVGPPGIEGPSALDPGEPQGLQINFTPSSLGSDSSGG